MTSATIRSLRAKTEKLMALLGAESVDFGHHDTTDGFFIEFENAKRGETGHILHFFRTTRAMHLYLNGKIKELENR